jgi:hypothetical protein
LKGSCWSHFWLAPACITSDSKVVHLEIINNSEAAVYMKLEGITNGGFYYLTIPDETSKTFSIVSDHYLRTTWSCNGVENSGTLIMEHNIRLTFIDCANIQRVNAFIGAIPPWQLHHKDVLETFPFLMNEPGMEKVFYYEITCRCIHVITISPPCPPGMSLEQCAQHSRFHYRY